MIEILVDSMLHESHLVVFTLTCREELGVIIVRQLYFLLLKVNENILVSWYCIALAIAALLRFHQLLHLELLLKLLILQYCHSIG